MFVSVYLPYLFAGAAAQSSKAAVAPSKDDVVKVRHISASKLASLPSSNKDLIISSTLGLLAQGITGRSVWRIS